MVTSYRRFLFISFSLAVFSPSLVIAQTYDGLDDDNDGKVDEADELAGGGNDMGRMEAVCNATAQIEACLLSHNMFCQQFGLPQSCALAEIGNNCNGGDPDLCQYYQDLMRAGMA